MKVLPVQCNIDAKGRAVRLLSGILHCAVGLGLAVLAGVAYADRWWLWALSAALVAAGIYQVFEGWAGWCVVRAMGFKTRI